MTQMKTATQASTKSSYQIIMRKTCRCGRPMGPSGECVECRRKRQLGGTLQTKLRISQPGDRYEQEADRVAEQILNLPGLNNSDYVAASEITKNVSPIRSDGESLAQVQRQPTEDIIRMDDDDEEKIVQTKRSPGQIAGNAVRPVPPIDSMLQGNGEPLSQRHRAFFEARLGHDFGQVRLYHDDRADNAARSLDARAFTLGNKIVFQKQEYAPDKPAGKSLLAHELVHVIQQDEALPKHSASAQADASTIKKTSGPMLQKKDCNFFVYDSTDSKFSTIWKYAALARAAAVRGGYVIPSSHTIEYMFTRLLRTFDKQDCDCIEEIQFWSHGSPGNAMSISKTDDEITLADFQIPNLNKFNRVPTLTDIVHNRSYSNAYWKWYKGLSWRQQLFVEVRNYICGQSAEIYYRSCQAFQGKTGQEFATQSASFWRSKVIGHTKIIGLTQPGQKVLKFGQEPDWSETEGAGETEYKKDVYGDEKGYKPKKD